MSTTIESRHVWTRDELILVTRAYLDGESVEKVAQLVPDIKISSVKNKYDACVYLDKKKRFKNVTSSHNDVWNDLKASRTVPDIDEVSKPEPDGWGEILEEDGETYFMCEGTCRRILHYEDTNEFQMCGKCEFKKGCRK
jgi:hypothetical protein